MVRFRHADGWTSGTVALSLRDRAEVRDDGTFDVPEDADTGTLQRLVDAGHTPTNPDALPGGVEYDEGGAGEETDADTGGDEGDGSEGDEGAGGGEAEAPGDDLDSLERSELWQLAHSDEFDEEPDYGWNDSTEEGLRDWIRTQRAGEEG